MDLLESCLKENRKKWKSCVIIPVHLYGHPADIKLTLELAEKYDCKVLEDSSQAHGAMVLSKKVGVFGDLSAFSLYPAKNLGAFGDAGIITTNNEELYNRINASRNYGSLVKYHYEFRGWNNRLDTIQAIVLNEKLKYLDNWNGKRIENAKKYGDLLENIEGVITPKTAPYVDKNVYHIYAIRVDNRDDLKEYLTKNNIPIVIHYPIPIQKTKPFLNLDKNDNPNAKQYANQLLSLPMHQFLTDDEINFIAEKINSYFNQ